MATKNFFSDTYAHARSKFLDVGAAVHARCVAYRHPTHLGPGGEELTVDVAIVGPERARSTFLLISGVHGVEGFAGSGCQVGFLVDRLFDAFGKDTAVVLVHAVNPFGFAWLRRVNEENVDLNRNFRDFGSPPPSAQDYEAVHGPLIPSEWEGPARESADAELANFAATWGMARFQAAVAGGQYTRAAGLFYGGASPAWSNTTFRTILRDHVVHPALEKLVALDIHTGLGAAGYGEPIYVGPPGAGYARAKAWFGSEVMSTGQGNAVSSPVTGSVADAIANYAGKADACYVALEYGTRPMLEVLTALRGDHWLHAVPDRKTQLRGTIERQIRDAFYVDTSYWQAGVYGRLADFSLRAARELAKP
jgi:hypothetical protein